MEMHERIRELRKNHLHLSQAAFGEKLGVSRDVIKNIELNILARPEQKLSLIKLMCKEFSVNEDWLLNGTEPKFIVTPSSIMEQLKKEFNLDDFSYHLVYEYLKLEPAQKTIVNNFLQSIVKEDEATCNDISSETCSVAEAEEAYIKSRSKLAKKTEQSVLNTTEDAAKTDKAVNQ